MTEQRELNEHTIAVLSENGGIFGNVRNFETAQRMAKALATSDLVPAQYQGKIANCMIAMEMAARTKSSIFAVMQNLHIIRGQPSWSASFIAAAINSCGRFEPLRYEFVGEPGTDEYGCYAWTYDKKGNLLKGPKVTIGMAKQEGWWSKKDRNGNETSKWQTMPDLMLCYRATSFFGRLYAPEILMGMYSTDEIHDIGKVIEADIVDDGVVTADAVEDMFKTTSGSEDELENKEMEPEGNANRQPDDLRERIETFKRQAIEEARLKEAMQSATSKRKSDIDENTKDLFGSAEQ